jgi:hypothetical protein
VRPRGVLRKKLEGGKTTFLSADQFSHLTQHSNIEKKSLIARIIAFVAIAPPEPG